MGRYLAGERYLSLLLRRRGKGPRRCGIEHQGQEDNRDMGDDRLMGVPDLVQYLQRALLSVLRVLEADTALGHTPLLQDDEVTILLHLIEGTKTIRDLQDLREVLRKIVLVITIVDHILQDMKMLVEMAMMRSMHTRLRKHHGLHGGHPCLVEHQGHLPGLDLGQLKHHQGVVDKQSTGRRRLANLGLNMTFVIW